MAQPLGTSHQGPWRGQDALRFGGAKPEMEARVVMALEASRTQRELADGASGAEDAPIGYFENLNNSPANHTNWSSVAREVKSSP